MSRYPFLKSEVREELVKREIGLDDILFSSEFIDARLNATDNIVSAISGNGISLLTGFDRVASFLISKMMLSAIGDPVITSKYVNAERDVLAQNLLHDLSSSEMANLELVSHVASALGLTFDTERLSDRWYVHVPFYEFVRYSQSLPEHERLLYSSLRRGRVYFRLSNPDSEIQQVVHLIRTAFVEKLRDEINSMTVSSEIYTSLENYLESVVEARDQYIKSGDMGELGEVLPEAFPPCVTDIVEKIRRGVNVSHEARFFMVAFLHHVGLSNNEIESIFSTAPDYNQRMTSYQIEHITGELTSREYTPQKCDTLKSLGLCRPEDALCRYSWVKHPLIYYRARKKRLSNGPPS